MRGFVVAAVLAFAAGCGGATESWVQLSWRFADERTCLDSGVSYVEVTSGNAHDDSTWGYFFCEHGFAPAAESLADMRQTGQKLVVTAYSAYDAPLYEGKLGPLALPTAVTVTLLAKDAE